MIASLIGAKGDNEIGMAGVAWNVRLMPLVALDADGAGTTANIARAIRYAVSHGASVINLSLVGYDYDESLDQLIRNAADAGVVMVAPRRQPVRMVPHHQQGAARGDCCRGHCHGLAPGQQG